MISDDLLATAARLAAGRPSQGDLRRAVSSVYYALFHAIAQSNADTLVGVDPQTRDLGAWRQTYRALEHRYARQRCIMARRNPRFTLPVQRLADHFVTMQEHRHRADYDPDATFSRSEVLAAITQIDAVIADFRAVADRERNAFAAYILMRERQD